MEEERKLLKHPTYSLKVIGCGLPRTGTLSVKAALEELKIGKCYHMIENFKNFDYKFWNDQLDEDNKIK